MINGKIYIGQDSKNNPDYLGSGKLIQRALNRYGRENFKKEILCYCKIKEKRKGVVEPRSVDKS